MAKKDSLFSRVALIYFVVSSILEYDIDKQIGKTFLQKIFYCLSRRKLSDFSYTLYHYGPYSTELSKELNFAENLDLLEIKWEDNKGYFIKPNPKQKELEKILSASEKKAIEKIIKRYIDFSAQELSILTTGYYMKDEYNIADNEMLETIHEIKPQYEIDYIESVLEKDPD